MRTQKRCSGERREQDNLLGSEEAILLDLFSFLRSISGRVHSRGVVLGGAPLAEEGEVTGDFEEERGERGTLLSSKAPELVLSAP